MLILTEYKYTFVKGTVSLWSVVNDKACMCIPLSFLNLNDAFKTLLRMVKPPKPWDSTETSLGWMVTVESVLTVSVGSPSFPRTDGFTVDRAEVSTVSLRESFI